MIKYQPSGLNFSYDIYGQSDLRYNKLYIFTLLQRNRMTKFIRLCIIIACSFLVCFGGSKLYTYFFDTQPPELVISGIEHEKYYSGDIPCLISLNDAAKVAHISLYIDGKPIITKYRINRCKAEYPCTIPTTALPCGPHELRIEVTDGSYHKNKSLETINFMVDNIPLQAAFVRSDADLKVFQGKTLHLVFQVSKPIKQATAKALGREISCVPEDTGSLVYEAFFPINCEDRPNEYPLTIEIHDYVGNTVTLDTKVQVVLFPFPQQNLTLNQADIERERQAGADEKELEDACATLVTASPKKKLWRGSFYPPTDMRRISTPFGTVRITQHRGKYAHRAVDLVSAPKHVVWAPQEGIIVLKNRFAHSGNTIVIDHGAGVFTLYFHLDSFGPYGVGDTVHQGNPIGTVGKTGFANGYHLHWELRVNNIAVDPLQWTQSDF